MASTVLSSFFAGATGHPLYSSSASTSTPDVEWAKSLWSQKERFFKDPSFAATFGKPSLSQITALEKWVRGLFEQSYYEQARQLIEPLKDVPGHFSIRYPSRFFKCYRVVHLDSYFFPVVLNPSLTGFDRSRTKSDSLKPGSISRTSLIELFEQGPLDDLNSFQQRAYEEVLGQSLDDFTQHYSVPPQGFAEYHYPFVDDIFKLLTHINYNSSLIVALSLAYQVARALYPNPLSNDAAAPLLLFLHQGIQKQVREPASRLYPLHEPMAQQVAKESPGAFQLYLSLAPFLGLDLAFKETSVRDLKAQLHHEFGLTSSGWKKLLQVAVDPEWSLMLSTQLYSIRVRIQKNGSLKKRRKASLFSAYGIPSHQHSYYSQLPTRPTTPTIALISALCHGANLSAQYQLNPIDVFLVMGMQPSGLPSAKAPFIQYSTRFLYIFLYMTPYAWRDLVRDLNKIPGYYTPDEKIRIKHLQTCWHSLLNRYHLKSKIMLCPTVFEALLGQGWNPSSDQADEQFLYQLYQAYQQHRRYAPVLFNLVIQEILIRPSEKLKEHLLQVSDLFMDADYNVWAHAPEKITLPWLKKVTADWHELSIHKAATEASWDPLSTEGFYCGEGFVAHELTSGQELTQEGRRMSHCVASYAKRCLMGQSRIFSIVSDDELTRSTLEIREHKSMFKRSFYIKQHRVLKNGNPSSEHLRAASHLLAEINNRQPSHPASFWGKLLFFKRGARACC